jgi:hypothetical protein
MFTQWNVKPMTLLILGAVVSVVLLLVILPDVDPPDTAFHRGTDPTAIHAQATAAPDQVIVTSPAQPPVIAETFRHFYQPGTLIGTPDPNSGPILLRSLRC